MAEEEKKNVRGDENRNPSPFPPGFRFIPTDDELIEYYLLPRLQDRPHVPNDAIIEEYVYSCHPDDLLLNGKYKDKCQDDTWYFLSPTARKYANGGRPSRGTHDRRGRWKATTGGAKSVTAGNVKYNYRGLSYYNGPSYKDEDKSNWLMRELTIPEYKNPLGDGSETKTLDKFVMCKIYMTTREPKNKKMPVDDGAGPSGKCEEKCPPASQHGPAETSQETAKPKISERQKGKRPVENAMVSKNSSQAPPPDRCLVPQAGAVPTQSLYGGGMQTCSGTTEYPSYYGGTGRSMAYNPHTSMPRPPMAFNSQMPAYRPTPVPSPGYFDQAMMMRQPGLAGQTFRPPRPMTAPSSPAGQTFRPPRPMTVPSSPAGQALRPPRAMTVPSSPAGQALRPPRAMTVASSPAGQASIPPRPTTVPSHPVMQRQPETEEMRERRVHQQLLNQIMMMQRCQRMMEQQQQQPGNAAYAVQQSRQLPSIQQHQQPHFGAGFNHQQAMPMPPQFLHCNYHQPPLEAGQQLQCGYPVPDSGAATTTPAEAEAGSVGAKNEGIDVGGGDCHNDKEKGSVEVQTEEQPRPTAMTPNMIQPTGHLAPKLESDD